MLSNLGSFFPHIALGFSCSQYNPLQLVETERDILKLMLYTPGKARRGH